MTNTSAKDLKLACFLVRICEIGSTDIMRAALRQLSPSHSIVRTALKHAVKIARDEIVRVIFECYSGDTELRSDLLVDMCRCACKNNRREFIDYAIQMDETITAEAIGNNSDVPAQKWFYQGFLAACSRGNIELAREMFGKLNSVTKSQHNCGAAGYSCAIETNNDTMLSYFDTHTEYGIFDRADCYERALPGLIRAQNVESVERALHIAPARDSEDARALLYLALQTSNPALIKCICAQDSGYLTTLNLYFENEIAHADALIARDFVRMVHCDLQMRLDPAQIENERIAQLARDYELLDV
jgi:hypothetical protein